MDTASRVQILNEAIRISQSAGKVMNPTLIPLPIDKS